MSTLRGYICGTSRPQSLFGLVSLQTGTELISLALICNKVTGVYGLLAVLTGYHLSFLQLSTYVYSIAVLAVLAYLIPHIRRQSPVECLALAWVYLLDTAICGAYTVAFGLEWDFARTTTDGLSSASSSSSPSPSLRALDAEGLDGSVVPQETAASLLLIAALLLVRVYFSVVVMAFARQVLQSHMQLRSLEGPAAAVEEREGRLAAEVPDGDGRKGRLGRLMSSCARGYWLDLGDTGGWTRSMHRKTSVGGTLAGEV